ncbi:MAG: MetQ/NlpA family ABC transporter substrate-binding protein [Butyricicoccaceae bacterium]
MKLKRIIALSLSAAGLALALTACGSSSSASDDAAQASGSSDAQTTVKLGVVGAIYEDIWAPAKEKLADEGIDLEFVQFSDYVTPNNALANGEIDLNAFQHRIYLQSEIDSYGYEIENIGNTFIIPLNLYSDKVKSVDELKDGDTVAIPDDATNGGRALKVLEAAGLIKLKDGADFNPTVDDIETYNKQIKIEELKANIIPSTLADVTAGVVNGNYALDFGLKTEDAIYKDDKLDIEEYWNLIAARTEDLSDPAKVETYKKVVAAFQSDETEAVFNDQFGGYFIKAGWDCRTCSLTSKKRPYSAAVSAALSTGRK